jgi:hypothetical protein
MAATIGSIAKGPNIAYLVVCTQIMSFATNMMYMVLVQALSNVFYARTDQIVYTDRIVHELVRFEQTDRI